MHQRTQTPDAGRTPTAGRARNAVASQGPLVYPERVILPEAPGEVTMKSAIARRRRHADRGAAASRRGRPNLPRTRDRTGGRQPPYLVALLRALVAATRWVTAAGAGVLLVSSAATRASEDRRPGAPMSARALDDVRIAETILLYQRTSGGWPKNYDRDATLTEERARKVRKDRDRSDSTFDNGATHTELAHLARVYGATRDERFRRAFERGLEFVLSAQYANGGWPQFYPDPRGYHAHITFNDGAMVGVMRLLSDVARGASPYGFVDEARRRRSGAAVERGVECILRCQIRVDGKRTAWCAQHDSKTLEPRKARSYELASISGAESVDIVRFLMGIESPSPEVVDAVRSAVAWFEEARLDGIRVVRKPAPSTPRGVDKVVVRDPSAPPLWARFHEIGTNRPIFCSRDGVPRTSLADISYERRNGYSWYSGKAARLLAKEYPAWTRRVGLER